MPPSRPRRLAPLPLGVVATVAAGALSLGGCGSGADDQDARPTPSPTADTSVSSTPTSTPSSTVSVPAGVPLTDQGSTLSFGDSARVIFESSARRGTVLRLTVRGVRRAGPRDFAGFALDDSYKKRGSYYYARVRVVNIGSGDVGGVPVPLWGVDAKKTLLPPVSFAARFAPCPSEPLPAAFPSGASHTTCLVFLSPNRGTLRAVSYRPSQAYDPITWTGTVEQPTAKPNPEPAPTAKPTPTTKPKPGTKPRP